MSSLVVHLGYHKTATTWLQNAIFSDEGLGFICPWDPQAGAAVDEFILANGFRFDATRARARFEEGLTKAREKGLVPVLSNEALCGQPVGSGWCFSYGKYVVERVHETFPESRVLIVVREQRGALVSHYRQYVANGSHGDLARFFGGPELPPGFAPICPLDHFEYDGLVGHTQSLFGVESVLVLPFEMLREERERFLTELCRFVGQPADQMPDRPPERVGAKGVGLAFKRFCNRMNFGKADWSRPKQSVAVRLVSRATRWVEQWTPEAWNHAYDHRISRYVEAQVGARYAQSNARLQQLTGMDLGRYGYALPPSRQAAHTHSLSN